MSNSFSLQTFVSDVHKVSATSAWRQLFASFCLLACAGEVELANEVLAYVERMPPPRDVEPPPSPEEVVASFRAVLGQEAGGADLVAIELAALARLCVDHEPEPPSTAFRYIEDPRRRHDEQWRYVQALARPEHGQRSAREAEAADELESWVPAWEQTSLGGGGKKVVLALDLALRHGRTAVVEDLVARHAYRFWSHTLNDALCLPAIARLMVTGGLRGDPSVAIPPARLAKVRKVLAARPPEAFRVPSKVPKVQKRRVSAEYGGVVLEPLDLAEDEKGAYFQRDEDHVAGMSLFPTRVGIGTPRETLHVDAQVSLSEEGLPNLGDAVQVVAFPLTVRGPLVLTGMIRDDGEDEPLVIPLGRYDVLARFYPAKATREAKESGFRVFRLVLTFHAEGALGAPQTLRLDGT